MKLKETYLVLVFSALYQKMMLKEIKEYRKITPSGLYTVFVLVNHEVPDNSFRFEIITEERFNELTKNTI